MNGRRRMGDRDMTLIARDLRDELGPEKIVLIREPRVGRGRRRIPAVLMEPMKNPIEKGGG
jgi:hypothetical protein